MDEADGINLRTRIVSVEKSDAQGDPGSVTVTIANKSKDIAGSISELQNRALINETYAQGATNQQIYNFTDNADATHPATLKLYISDSVVRINKMLLNIQFEAFRAYEKQSAAVAGRQPPAAADKQRHPAAVRPHPAAAGLQPRPAAEQRHRQQVCEAATQSILRIMAAAAAKITITVLRAATALR